MRPNQAGLDRALRQLCSDDKGGKIAEGSVELNEQGQLCLRRTSDAQDLTIYLETGILLFPVAHMPHWTEKCSSHAQNLSSVAGWDTVVCV